jgi:hypothetical protein
MYEYIHVLCTGVPPAADVWRLAGLHQPGAGAGAAAGRLLTPRQHRHGLPAPRVLGRHKQSQQQVLHNVYTAWTQKLPLFCSQGALILKIYIFF